MSMKKMLAALLLAALALTLCACGLNAQPEYTPIPAPTPAPADVDLFRVDLGGGEAAEEAPAETEAQTPEEEPAAPAEQTPAPEAEPAAVPETVEPLSLDADTNVQDTELVRVLSYMPDLKVDLKYATTDNYTGDVVYAFDEPYLRYGTVKKLAAAQSVLKEQGYELVLWDAFRPGEAQQLLFDAFPNAQYVANPYGGGHSSHTSGGTVDVALMKDGALVALPSGFDEFSALGDRNYNDVSAEAAANAKTLETVMTACGFSGYFGEWWHYTDNTGYNYDDVEFAKLPEHASGGCESVCNEYINIRRMPNVSSEAIGRVPNGEQMTVLGYYSYFTHIQYGDVVGYVNSDYTKPAN